MAWAVVERGAIDLRSVGPTRRSAIVNWLYTEKKVTILNTYNDELIEQTWREWCGDAICTTVEVSVSYASS